MSTHLTPFAVDADGRKYVAVSAMMHPLVACFDGLSLVTFGDEDRPYLTLADAIAFAEQERSCDPLLYDVVLKVLRKFHLQNVEPE